MTTLLIVQARLNSQRFPKKVLQNVNDITLIELILRRAQRALLCDKVIVATGPRENNQELIDVVSDLGFSVFQGDENDVLDRFYQAALIHEAEYVVRVTGDCPFVDAGLIDLCVTKLLNDQELDYVSNVNPPTYPDGLDVEAFTFSALEKAWLETTSNADREHVTPYIRESGNFTFCNVQAEQDYSRYRLTVDEKVDLNVINKIMTSIGPDIYFSFQELLTHIQRFPELVAENSHISRNEGASMSAGQKLWKRARDVIPSGNMLLSKNPDMFLPGYWPSYFSRASGCDVWDIDGNQYTDMSMAVGTNLLGYAHERVDSAVRNVVNDSNMSVLNCPEEVQLAERLVDLHSWADMAKFTRSGGEANAVAIRIARAATGKDNVAICGYHGWHDWYLSTNLNDVNGLDSHLLPGLEPLGVPRALSGTTIPFMYNDIEALEKIISEKDLAAIKMEVIRSEEPQDNFLHKVRALATKHNIVLIFDECTSGFRQACGGLHKVYGVEPDLLMLGKALGNGYAINAVLGRREVMEAAKNSFISSTFWTERIGPTAALCTLEVMAETKSWEYVSDVGAKIKNRWRKILDNHGLHFQLSGIDALPAFVIKADHWNTYKTYITQEMLKRGFLASNTIYVSTAHSADVLERYFIALDSIFEAIAEAEASGNHGVLLDGIPAQVGFGRLN